MSIDAVTQTASVSDALNLALVERAQAGDAGAFEMLIDAPLLAVEPSGPLHHRQRGGRSRRAPGRAASTLGESCRGCAIDAVRSLALADRPELVPQPGPGAPARSCPRDPRSSTSRAANVAAGSAAGPGDALSENDLIQRAFQRLDPDKRTILILHHVEERSISDIAALLGIPAGTAKWRLFSARRALERALEVERR